MWNIKVLSLMVPELWQMLVFRYTGQSQLWYQRKDIITRNVRVKYGSPTSNGSKGMDNFQVLTYTGQRVQVTRSNNLV